MNNNMPAISANKPPYVAYKTFSNFIGSLRESGLPNRIDRSVLPGQSGSTQSFLLSTLRFLGLINEEGIPSSPLADLVSHPANEKATLDKVIKESYKFIFTDGFNLQAATESQLRERFEERGLSGETIRKSVSFFLIACEHAGIPLSVHVRGRRDAGNGTTLVRRQYRRRHQVQQDTPAVPPESSIPNESLQDKLIAKFPEFDPEWSEELQKKWFEAFDKFMSTAKKADAAGGAQTAK
jgi:hypothetical protein